MQSIFNQSASPSRGVLVTPMWSHVRQGLNRNLNQVIAYYQAHNFAARSNHFLVRLLGALKTSFNQPAERFYDQVDNACTSIAVSMQMTSALHSGTIFDGVFYGFGVKEILIANNEPIDFFSVMEDWRNQSPIKVLSHPKTDLDMHVPSGTAYSNEKGLAVISINIPMLALMYYKFSHEQVANMAKGKSAATTAQFVMTYVLPNMLPSHLDIAVVNRICAFAQDKPLGTPIRKHAMALGFASSQTDKALMEVKGFLEKTNLSLHDMLCTVPAVTATNGLEALALPRIAATRKYLWAEAAARINYIASMMLLSPLNVPMNDKGQLQQEMRRISETGAVHELTSKLDQAAPDILEAYQAVNLFLKA